MYLLCNVWYIAGQGSANREGKLGLDETKLGPFVFIHLFMYFKWLTWHENLYDYISYIDRVGLCTEILVNWVPCIVWRIKLKLSKGAIYIKEIARGLQGGGELGQGAECQADSERLSYMVGLGSHSRISFIKVHEKIGGLEGALGNSTEPQEEVLMSLSVWSCGWVAVSFQSVVWGARTPHGWIQIGHDHHLWVSTALSAVCCVLCASACG